MNVAVSYNLFKSLTCGWGTGSVCIYNRNNVTSTWPNPVGELAQVRPD